MRVIEKEWKYGKYLAYADVEPELLELTPGCRVLPAPYFYEKRLYFTLIKRYEPGEHPHFPNGGYTVNAPNLSVLNYDLDQVILHPLLIKHQKTLDKMKRKAEKEQVKREKQREKILKKVNENKTPGKRGRKPLSDEEKQKRATEKTTKTNVSGGKRGRPKGSTNGVPKIVKEKTGKRGRPPMSEEMKLKRQAEIDARRIRSGGKRGRPKRK